MRKYIVLILALVLNITITCYATEASAAGDGAITGDVYARYINTVDWEKNPVQDGCATAIIDSGYNVSVTGAPDNADVFRAVSIPNSEAVAWKWFESCLDGNVSVLSILDLYFEDNAGNRINADGVNVLVSNVENNTSVFSVTTTGISMKLDYTTSSNGITYQANGSHYYVMAKVPEKKPVRENNATIVETDGGSVTISNKKPNVGDIVIITPTSDEGKEVDMVVIKDKNGNEISVTQNGDGTYSYTHPDGDVIIEITFKNKLGSKKPSSPVTGDNSQIIMWTMMLFLLMAVCMRRLLSKRRKNRICK